MENDIKIKEIYEELQKKQEVQEKSVMRKIPQNTKLLFLGVVCVLVWSLYTGKIDKQMGMFIALSAGAVIYLSVSSQPSESRPLTEEECRVQLHHQLRNKQLYSYGQHYQIPPRIKIRQERVGKLRNLESKPWKWVLGVSFYDPDTYLKKFYAAICNAYTGSLEGLKELPGGLSDLELKDIQLIPDYKMWQEKKYHDYMGKYWKGGEGGG